MITARLFRASRRWARPANRCCAAAVAVVAALLLGKTAQAAERGVDLRLDPDSRVSALPVEGRDMVTLLGNLLDNAFDAVAERDERRVEVRVVAGAGALELDVSDNGPGLPDGVAEQAFRRGWSTKRGDAGIGRGLGLALVGQVARKYGGRVSVSQSSLGGARFTVRIPS